MRLHLLALFYFLIFFLFFPLAAQAFWGNDEERSPVLNFESGYDVNTVTTVTGRILSMQVGADRPNLQLEIEEGATRMMVFLGPQRYWVEQGLPLQVGDKVTVRGSKAQGQDGVIYILAREIMVISQGVAVILRDESGHPKWSDGEMRNSNPNPTYGRYDGRGGSGKNGGGGGHGGGGHGGGGGR